MKAQTLMNHVLEDDETDDSDYQEDAHSQRLSAKLSGSEQWASFVHQVEMIDDPLLISIFKHGQYKSFEESSGKLEVSFAKQFVFFQEWLAGSIAQWKPLLDKVFGLSVTLNPQFTDDIAPVIMQMAPRQVPQAQPVPASDAVHSECRSTTGYQFSKQKPWQSTPARPKRPAVDVSDASLWPKAAMIMRHFPGVVRQY